MTLYHVSSNKCQGAYFQISTKRMGTYPKKGTESRGRLFFFPLNKPENGQGVPREKEEIMHRQELCKCREVT